MRKWEQKYRERGKGKESIKEKGWKKSQTKNNKTE